MAADAGCRQLGGCSIAARQLRYRMNDCDHCSAGSCCCCCCCCCCCGGCGSGRRQEQAEIFPNPWVRRGDSRTTAMELRPLTREDPKPQECHDVADCRAPAAKALSLAQIVRVNFVKYCQTTSLRGVPKIVKTKERLLKHIWAAFVLLFFVGCLTCLGLIVKQYLDYDVIHQPRTVRNYAVQFPSFTVCNTRPLSQEGIAYVRSRRLMLPKQYSKHVITAVFNMQHNMQPRHAANGINFNGTVRDALSTIFNTKGYYENIPVGVDVSRFGHTLDQTILFCESTILIKDFRRSMFCDRIGTWTRTYDNHFLNCYTFTADAEYTKKILTVRIMAYTNERNDTECPDCSSFPATQVSGLRVQLHNAGNYPEVQEEGLNIRPGSLTEIRFETKQWVMKEPPHGRCSQKVPPVMRFSGNNFTYSYQACKKQILHEQIRQQCGCLDSTIPLPASMSNSPSSHCGRIPQLQFSLAENSTVVAEGESERVKTQVAKFYNVSKQYVKLPSFINNAEFKDFLRKVTCNMEIFKVAGQVTANQCFTPCKFYTYETTISTTNWPTKAYLFEIVKDFREMKRRIDKVYRQGNTIRNSSYLDPIFAKMEQVYQPVYDMRRRDEAAAQRMLNDIDFVQSNFIEILINRGKSNFDIEEIKEKAVISLTSLLSQIGGLLSIWVGLTFVCIVEIIEMLYNIAHMYSSQRRAAS